MLGHLAKVASTVDRGNGHCLGRLGCLTTGAAAETHSVLECDFLSADGGVDDLCACHIREFCNPLTGPSSR